VLQADQRGEELLAASCWELYDLMPRLPADATSPSLQGVLQFYSSVCSGSFRSDTAAGQTWAAVVWDFNDRTVDPAALRALTAAEDAPYVALLRQLASVYREALALRLEACRPLRTILLELVDAHSVYLSDSLYPLYLQHCAHPYWMGPAGLLLEQEVRDRAAAAAKAWAASPEGRLMAEVKASGLRLPAAPALDYPPLLTLGALAAALVLLLAAVARLLGSHPRLASQGRAPASAYECGFVPYAGLVSGSLFVFFRLAVFFVVFEAELIFLLPWATSLLPAAEAGALRPFLAPLAFLVALAYGFGREVRGGALALLRRAPGRLFEVVLWEDPFGAVLGRLLRRRPVPPPNPPLLPSPPTPDRKPAFALPRALG
jgi:NADH-quinone oxidoreductase subunit A